MIIENKTIVSVNPNNPAEYQFFQQNKDEWEKEGYIIKNDNTVCWTAEKTDTYMVELERSKE